MKQSYRDPTLSPKDRARLLLAEMSAEEKMGQIVGYNPMDWNEEAFRRACPNGCGQISMLGCTGKKTIEEAAAFQREVQRVAMDLSEHHIPAFFHVEGLTGVLLAESAGFPTGIGQGATWDVSLQEEMAQVIGREARAAGASDVLAPVLDVAADARFGRIGESYGEDPTLAAAMGTAYVRGLQNNGDLKNRPLATAKHFLGFHGGAAGIHGAVCDIPERRLREIYGKPFQAAITQGGLRSVMSSYGTINGEPVAGSKAILTGILREEMGMDGYVVADYNAVSDVHGRTKTARSREEAGRRCLEAGLDCELPFPVCYGQAMLEDFRSGRLDMELLDRAVLRALELKFALGLFERPFALEDAALREVYGRQDKEELSLRSARESIVLLKNDGILPLEKPYRTVAVIGHHAGASNAMFGGYTYASMIEGEFGAENTMAGVAADPSLPLEEIIARIVEQENKKPKYPGSLVKKESEEIEAGIRKRIPGAENLLDALRKAAPETEFLYACGYPFDGDDASGFAAALETAKRADLVILTLGPKYATGSSASEGEGIDSAEIGLPRCQEAFLAEYRKLGKPTVAIHFGGRPVSSDLADECANALIEAWNPGVKGPRALTEILYGKYNPGGRLPVTAARCTGQMPLTYNHPNGSAYSQGMNSAFQGYVNCPHEPRYYFGHGLSYTTFAYSNLQVSARELEPFEELTLTVDIENTGKRAGDEVVQLYVRDLYASMVRPNMELAGFVRVRLTPGEKKRIVFRMQPGQFAFLDKDMKWKIEEGELEFLVGASCRDIRLQETARIRKDAWTDGRARGFYAKTAVEEI